MVTKGEDGHMNAWDWAHEHPFAAVVIVWIAAEFGWKVIQLISLGVI